MPFSRTRAGYKCYKLDGERSVWSGDGMAKVQTGLSYRHSSKKFMKDYNDFKLQMTSEGCLWSLDQSRDKKRLKSRKKRIKKMKGAAERDNNKIEN